MKAVSSSIAGCAGEPSARRLDGVAGIGRTRRGGRKTPVVHRWLLCAITVMGIAQAGCSSSSPAPGLANSSPTVLNTPDAGGGCVFPDTGCACTEPGSTTDCGTVKEQIGDQVVCVMGVRTCTNGVWGACEGSRTTTVYVPNHHAGYQLQALAGSSVDCGNLCAPQCQKYVDTPAGLDAGTALNVTDAGVSIAATSGSCSTITVTATTPASSPGTITLTELNNPLNTPQTIQFTATCAGGLPLQPQWAIGAQDFDYAGINSTTGLFTVYTPIAKDITVYARTGAGTATGTAHIKIQVSTGTCASSSAFNSAPTITDPDMILYPYAIAARPVVFPLAMTAPLLQYGTGGTTASCVRTTLCYPTGTCTPGSTAYTFRWDKYASGEPTQGSVDNTQPAVTIDQAAWNSFSTTAKGTSADIVLQRLNSSSKAMTQKVATVIFASDALRGTVYFTQYQSTFPASVSGQSYTYASGSYPSTNASNGQLSTTGVTCPVGNPTHIATAGGSTVASINLGTAGSPLVDAFSSYNTSGTGCPVCHSLSANGATLVTTGNLWLQWGAGGGVDVGLNQVRSDGTLAPIADAPQYSFPWDSTTWAEAASTSVTNFPGGGDDEPSEDSRAWPYSAITPDGRYVLQGPNNWGNTRDDISANNTQDGSYASTSLATFEPTSPPGGGHKHFFLMDTSNYVPANAWSSSSPTTSFDPSIDYATEAALPNSYTGNATTLTSTTNGLSVDCVNNGTISLTTGKTLLVKNETGANAKYNGVYTVTQTNKWILTRTINQFSYNQRFRVDSGKSLGSNPGSTSGQFPQYYYVTTANPITVNTSAINFALWTTVRAATTAALPKSPASAANSITATGSTSMSTAFGSDDTLVTGMRILVWKQTVAAQNGIYTITALGSSSSTWQLTRDADMSASNEVTPNMLVQVTDGSSGGNTYQLTTSGSITLNTTGLAFSLATSNDSLLNSTTMMVPEFSPDGTKLIYVNGDADTISGSSTGWRRGLSMMSFNESTLAFSNKIRLINNYSASTAGPTIKWPFFESDSRSVVYVQSDPNEFCPRQANYGQCDNSNCTSNDSSVDTNLERACFEGSYGNMSPTTRGYWYGKLYSVDSGASTPANTNTELAWLNSNNRASNSANMNAADANKVYQPTVLPFSAGTYRWVIFTSQRSYGNQFNAVGTDFSCSAGLLWMAALDDLTASTLDRSHPAFLLPGQNIAKVTAAHHYVNERGYIVPSPCKSVGTACSVSAECCGATGTSPTAACTIDTPITMPVTRHCANLQSCASAGQACTQNSDCCVSGSTCFQGACADPPKYYQAKFTRDYHVDCTQPPGGLGYQVVWGNFSWNAQAAGDSSIVFGAQSNATGTFTSSDTSVSLGQADSTNINPPPNDAHSVDVGQSFKTAYVPTNSYLRITMTFNPTSDHLSTPTLYNWNLQYNCVPAE